MQAVKLQVTSASASESSSNLNLCVATIVCFVGQSNVAESTQLPFLFLELACTFCMCIPTQKFASKRTQFAYRRFDFEPLTCSARTTVVRPNRRYGQIIHVSRHALYQEIEAPRSAKFIVRNRPTSVSD